MRPVCLLIAALCLALPLGAAAQNADVPKKDPPQLDTSRGDAMIAAYFRRQTQQLADACLADIHSAEDWNANKDEYRRQLREMLGLDPLPERTDLKAAVTGTLDHAEFAVEKLHFQSRPGLYVTGNLYVPKAREGRLPAILYVCGHGNVKKDGVSYGAKAHYQHHGAWFARNGYVCLVIDTLQLGEIEGIHHGTYRYGMWWWVSRGYTPAGVEAWNCVRALDYLQSRPEVDPDRLGVTGRSGGGAYSWWIAAIDERIKCAVPVAGITDLQNHVVDGCVEGHCDCMYMVNTYRWDYPQVAALVAPRPLLISNTDSDGIFPLDGVVRVFEKARRIYSLLGQRDMIGLNITPGGHKDTQELQVAAMRWFNHHLRGYDGPVTNHAEKLFEPEQLKVFDKLPEDQINTKIHETFVPAAAPRAVPPTADEWKTQWAEMAAQLEAKCVRGWPDEPPPRETKLAVDYEHDGIRYREYEFTSEEGICLVLQVIARADLDRPQGLSLEVMDQEGIQRLDSALVHLFPEQYQPSHPTERNLLYAGMLKGMLKQPAIWAYVAPRGVGRFAWDQSEKKQLHHRRRFLLLGQTLEGQQAWDAVAAIGALGDVEEFTDVPVHVQGPGSALFCAFGKRKPRSLRISLTEAEHDAGPLVLNLGRVMSLSDLAAMAASNVRVHIIQRRELDFSHTRAIGQVLGWGPKQFAVTTAEAPKAEGPVRSER